MLSEGMADRIIGLYALGTNTRDISNWLEETVGTSVSAETISSITDRVLLSLKPGVTAAWMKSILSFGSILGLYVSKSEGANFWLNVLTDLQKRGVKDIMIACIDGLSSIRYATP